MSDESPLAGVTVVEIASWMACPSAAAILADMGADVVKVEPPAGDPMRDYSRPPRLPEPKRSYDYQFDVDNRGKRSVSVDLSNARGQALVRRLCGSAHVVLTNLLPERQRRFGLDPSSVFAVNPGIVHATLTGYGLTGPESWRPGFDATAYFARSGLLERLRDGEDGAVVLTPTAQGDHTAGLALVGAVLAALRLAERTGRGQIVETSLLATAVWTLASDYSVTAQDRAAVRVRSRRHAVVATTNNYRCGDGRWLAVYMPGAGSWRVFCRVVGVGRLLADERLADVRGRFTHMPEIVDAVDSAMAARARDEWGELFDRDGIIWAPVSSLDEVVNDPHAAALGLFPTLEAAGIGKYPTVRNPIRFETADVRPRARAPRLGEHTVEVLHDVGLADAEVRSLVDDGVVSEDAACGRRLAGGEAAH